MTEAELDELYKEFRAFLTGGTSLDVDVRTEADNGNILF